ncbi:hypothetical protein SCHPADRAFT_671492 [Schizopora paradoxa]|uniref:Uncharacterized protein n=1 Tax=Schizopora paradoxa TaxID=27342 RepID=A0A0H2R6I4_9AGAM|nr:hypothetical protein SCHPADRAFT_671492 [Schizopora paradoxa]
MRMRTDASRLSGVDISYVNMSMEHVTDGWTILVLVVFRGGQMRSNHHRDADSNVNGCIWNVDLDVDVDETTCRQVCKSFFE